MREVKESYSLKFHNDPASINQPSLKFLPNWIKIGRGSLLIILTILLVGCTSSEKSFTPIPSVTSQPSPSLEETKTPQPVIAAVPTASPTVDLEPLPEISLCEDDWEGEYCIYTLGFSSDRQVISLKHTEDAQVEILLIVNDEKYACQTVEDYPGNLYCIGPKISIFQGARVVIVTLEGEEALAGGEVDLPYLVQEPTKPADDPGYY